MKFLLIASALAVTGCAGSRAIIRYSKPADRICLESDCRRLSDRRVVSSAEDRQPAWEPQYAMGPTVDQPVSEPTPARSNPYLLASNSTSDFDSLEQIRGSLFPEEPPVDYGDGTYRHRLEPYRAPPIIDIDDIRAALRGSVAY